MAGMRRGLTATCRCGRAAVEVADDPFLSVVCCCASCRAAGLEFEREPGAAAVLRPDGGTDYCLYRKDRVRVAHGGERLEARRLTPGSPTRRVLATCCNTPMFLDFTPGHWLTLYRDRVRESAPAPQMRLMAMDAPSGATFTDGIPTYPRHSAMFVLKLFGAWAAMGFRRPVMDW